MYDHRGVFGRDFPPEMYEPYQDEAEAALKEQIKQILATKSKDLILDYSFWSKENRDKYRRLIEAEGGGSYQSKGSRNGVEMPQTKRRDVVMTQ